MRGPPSGGPFRWLLPRHADDVAAVAGEGAGFAGAEGGRIGPAFARRAGPVEAEVAVHDFPAAGDDAFAEGGADGAVALDQEMGSLTPRGFHPQRLSRQPASPAAQAPGRAARSDERRVGKGGVRT